MTEILSAISVLSDIAIIFLLAVQSYVLWKLKDPIISTAKNSEVYKKLFGIDKNETSTIKQSGCIEPNNPNHIHSKECFN